MKLDSVIFYGDFSQKGYQISYLLIDRNIEHDFVVHSNISLHLRNLRKVRELWGFEEVIEYLETFRYYFDFPEISKWN